eukprot:TRINITY_DN416_c0_g1_i1.p1 TRINITY_DN416_c0_g1~~TRINITY_DN416_c0_g1_i1.p1  ORF type:complete len:433 (+),score=57.93 TRINITY_DN416_c0_g1_i1:51-1349(+)
MTYVVKLIIVFICCAYSQTCSKYFAPTLLCPQTCFCYNTTCYEAYFNGEESYAVGQLTSYYYRAVQFIPRECRGYLWRYLCFSTFSNCKNDTVAQVPAMKSYLDYLGNCSLYIQRYGLDEMIQPPPTPSANIVAYDIFGTFDQAQVYGDIFYCGGGTVLPTPTQGLSIVTYQGNLTTLTGTGYPQRVFLKIETSGKSYFTGLCVLNNTAYFVDGFMKSTTEFVFYNRDNITKYFEFVGTSSGLNINGTWTSYDNPSTGTFTMRQQDTGEPPSPVPSIGLGEFFMEWQTIAGLVVIGAYLIVTICVLIYMKYISDNDYHDVDNRAKLFLKIRVVCTIALAIIVAICAVITAFKVECSGFKVFANGETFSECTGSACSTACGCNAGDTCCVAYSKITYQVWSFCKSDIVMWYAMIAPIALAVGFAVVVFVTTQK